MIGTTSRTSRLMIGLERECVPRIEWSRNIFGLGDTGKVGTIHAADGHLSDLAFQAVAARAQSSS